MDIGPDTIVECINNSPRYVGGEWSPSCPELTVGSLYAVLEVTPPDEDGMIGVTLSGLPCIERLVINRGHVTRWEQYAICRFRPVYRRSDKFKKALMEPVAEGVADMEKSR